MFTNAHYQCFLKISSFGGALSFIISLAYIFETGIVYITNEWASLSGVLGCGERRMEVIQR